MISEAVPAMLDLALGTGLTKRRGEASLRLSQRLEMPRQDRSI
jgi:hypothetical protein